MCAQYDGHELSDAEINALIKLEKLGQKKPLITSENGSVVKLNLQFFNLIVFPKSIFEFKKLISLDLGYNQINEIPESINELTTLKSLVLRVNRLSKVPESIWDLKRLINIDLSFNQLTSVSNLIEGLLKLEELDLSFNRITSLPKSIGGFVRLKELDVSNNKIPVLPESICDLKSLEKLDVSDNKLPVLPELIGNLKNLKNLDVSDNLLYELPKSISDIKNLDINDKNNFQLIYKYFPLRNYDINVSYSRNKDGKVIENIKKEDGDRILQSDRKNVELQKKQLNQLCKSENTHYFWDHVIKEKYEDISIKDIKKSRLPWKFKLFLINSEDGVNTFRNSTSIHKKDINPENDKKKKNIKSVYYDHPERKNNFVELQLLIWSVESNNRKTIRLLSPLIRSITVTVETNRGDSIPVVFTDFYFKKYHKSQILPSLVKRLSLPDTIFMLQETAYLKFDEGFIMEPFANLVFTDVKVEYEDSIIPTLIETNPEMELLKKKMELIDKKLDKLITNQINPALLIDESKTSLERLRIVESNKIKLRNEKLMKMERMEKIDAIVKLFKRGWEEPVLPDVMVEIGHNVSGKLGKYADSLAAGVILMSSLPAAIQFLMRMRYNPITYEITKIDIPVIAELLTYLPLVILLLILTFKFIKRQRVPKY